MYRDIVCIHFKVPNGIVLDRVFDLNSQIPWYPAYTGFRVHQRAQLLRDSGKTVLITNGFKISGAMF